MRSLPMLLAAAAALAPSIALAQRQAPSQEELQKRYEEKIAKPWLKNAKWTIDLEDAKKQAQETGKPIFAYFTRSYSP